MQNTPGPQSFDGHEADWDAISRFVAGESDQVESRAVEAWLVSHPADAALVSVIRERAGMAERRSAITVDTEAALRAVLARIDADASPAQASTIQAAPADACAETTVGTARLVVSKGGAPKPATIAGGAPDRRSRSIRWPLFMVAAAAAVFAVFVRQRSTGAQDRPVQTFATTVGIRDSVRLADGSRVFLAPGSKLTVAAGYGASVRDVTIDGAAFFEVQHDSAHPFTVHAGQTEIRDIGTAFSVKTDPMGGVSVAVTHGVVSVRSALVGAVSAPVELRAGDKGDVSGVRVAVTRGRVTEEDVSWTRGQLTYRDAPMSEVQADLRRWYGVDLRFADEELARRTLTTALRTDSAASVIRLIALALGADAVQHGDTVVLRMTGRGTTP